MAAQNHDVKSSGGNLPNSDVGDGTRPTEREGDNSLNSVAIDAERRHICDEGRPVAPDAATGADRRPTVCGDARDAKTERPGEADGRRPRDEAEPVSEADRRRVYQKGMAVAPDAKSDPDGGKAFALAFMLETGYGCAPDDAAAHRWYRTSADRGCALALTILGCRAREAGSHDAAQALFEEAVARDDGDGMFHLAEMLRHTQPSRALELCHAAAHRHDVVDAWNLLGCLHESGADLAAARWAWQKAAARSSRDALAHLARTNPPPPPTSMQHAP